MSESDDPKIIVDEDWKSQVEQEKEQLRKEEEAKSTEPEHDIPEASFQVLLATLSTQAMAMMGLLPNIGGEAAPVNLPMARHVIDMIGVLDEKTRGNLTDEESKTVTESLHQLRMAFVEVSRNPQVPKSSEENVTRSSTIELP